MAHFFISYSRKNEQAVRALARDVEALGHDVWIDHELTGGQAWWDEILLRIRACGVFVFALSPPSLDSTACKRELRYAEALDKRILPVLLTDGVSTNLLPPALSTIQYVDYRTPSREAALALARTLVNLPPPNPLPDPLPEPPEVPVSYLTELKDVVDSSGILQFDEQATLAFQLKEKLNDPEVADDVRGLMRRFRARPDLLARVAEDIDAALGPKRPAAAEPEAPGASAAWSPGQPPTAAPDAIQHLFDDASARPKTARAPDGEGRRAGRQRAGERRGQERREKKTRGSRGLRIVGGVICAFFALSAFAYSAEWGDAVALLLGIGLAVAAYKLITT